VRTSIDHHQRINVLAALAISPTGKRIRLHTRRYHRSLTGQEVLAFLRQLLRAIRGPIVLVWDNAPIHRRALVQRYLEAHPRVQVIPFARYVPELNPVEFVWTQLSQYLAGRAPATLGELAWLIHVGLQRTRQSSWRLWACIAGTPLRWRRWRSVR
jgi:transposase